MGFRWFTVLISFLALPNAGAFSPTCPKRAYDDLAQISSLIVKASIAERDDRGALTEKAAELGLTPHDVDHIRKSTGFIFCPGTKYGNKSLGAGTIVGEDDQIVTNRHLFIDESGRPRDPLSKCEFRNQASPFSRRYLNLKDGEEGIKEAIARGFLRLGTKDGQSQSDIAVVKMVKPIPGAKAFSINPSGFDLHGCDGHTNCQKIVAISAYQARMPVAVSMTEPIAQSCTVRDVYGPNLVHGSSVYSDCSATKGSSGSINFLQVDGTYMRDANGELVPFAFFVGGNAEKGDHLPYDLAGYNFTLSLVLDGPAGADVIALANGPHGSQNIDSVKLMVPSSSVTF